MVIVGLEPAPPNHVPLPEGARAPRFSAGPESGTGGQQRSAAVIVPGLTVQGKGSGSAVMAGATPKAPPLYQQEPSPAAWAQAAAGKDSRRVARSMMSAALRPGARVIAPVVEARFSNRPVYTTSFEVGADGAMEWVIWFAEQDARDTRFLTVRPPVPWSRIDPGPDPSSLLPDRLEIAAVIDKTGLPASVRVLNAPDQSLADAAAQLINGWVFLPALRNGEPMTVDALIELSFRRKP
jgi:Gram-negative bacterial TonB protein C-terminal